MRRLFKVKKTLLGSKSSPDSADISTRTQTDRIKLIDLAPNFLNYAFGFQTPQGGPSLFLMERGEDSGEVFILKGFVCEELHITGSGTLRTSCKQPMLLYPFKNRFYIFKPSAVVGALLINCKRIGFVSRVCVSEEKPEKKKERIEGGDDKQTAS
ncbi:hypothetical protein PGTUg99_024082 [Puccinia graminis f. sp. tritici]|uniref:Uncharacterized protein n=1 Tax=Puccinia graminis f. sp. tritici TaxID=56615 RepID=A0A5B0P3Z5_PUCGR|nr:hypothetical protein PGTUg99_024082 [Puccinia graminis f. sp. tritici]